MKYLFFFTLFFLSIETYCQSGELQGKWFLDKITYQNGNDLEINHPEFSTKVIYIISKNSLKINSHVFKANYSSNSIKTDFRKMNYSLDNNNLKVSEVGVDKIYYFVKKENFIKKNPEFKPSKTIRYNDTLLIANDFSDYNFKNDLEYEEFISKNMPDHPSKSFEKLYFEIEFVLTKEGKIKNIVVLNSISQTYDDEYLIALKKAEKFFVNSTGYDLLITKEVNHLKFYNDLSDNNEKKMLDLLALADRYYNSNKFEKAIVEYNKIMSIQIKENRFKLTLKDALKRLGISNLAIGNLTEACINFRTIGDETDFEIRNYLKKFCP